MKKLTVHQFAERLIRLLTAHSPQDLLDVTVDINFRKQHVTLTPGKSGTYLERRKHVDQISLLFSINASESDSNTYHSRYSEEGMTWLDIVAENSAPDESLDSGCYVNMNRLVGFLRELVHRINRTPECKSAIKSLNIVCSGKLTSGTLEVEGSTPEFGKRILFGLPFHSDIQDSHRHLYSAITESGNVLIVKSRSKDSILR